MLNHTLTRLEVLLLAVIFTTQRPQTGHAQAVVILRVHVSFLLRRQMNGLALAQANFSRLAIKYGITARTMFDFITGYHDSTLTKIHLTVGLSQVAAPLTNSI